MLDHCRAGNRQFAGELAGAAGLAPQPVENDQPDRAGKEAQQFGMRAAAHGQLSALTDTFGKPWGSRVKVQSGRAFT